MATKTNEKKDIVQNPYRRAIIKILNNKNLSKKEKYNQSYLAICSHVLENVGFRGTKKSEMLELIEIKTNLRSVQLSAIKEINLELLEKIYKFGLIDLKYLIKRSKAAEIKKQEAVKKDLINVYQKNKTNLIDTNIIIPKKLIESLIKVNDFHVKDILGGQKKYYKEQVRKLNLEMRVAIEGYQEGWWS
jgi:hypothetical protein